MGFEYYYIIIALVILKICIWICVLYFRAQRTRTARAERRFVVVDSRSTGQVPPGQNAYPSHPEYLPHTSIPPNSNRRHNDRSAIVDFEEPPAMSQAPPSYTEVMSQPMPPPYSQVVSGQAEETRTPIPPHFTPPPEQGAK